MNELVHDYFDKTQAKENLPPLDMDWPTYIEMERNGNVVVVGAYDNERLVGFVMYVVAPNLHHRTLKCAACDIIGVRPEYRNQHIARHLMAVAEKRMRDAGVHYISHQFRTDYETEPLFGKLGYDLIEQCYRKRIA
jgi:GNAT superfamily N-acetyltransferase